MFRVITMISPQCLPVQTDQKNFSSLNITGIFQVIESR